MAAVRHSMRNVTNSKQLLTGSEPDPSETNAESPGDMKAIYRLEM